jgi:hypothetical protein
MKMEQSVLNRRQVGIPACEDGTDRVFRNFSVQNSDAGELSRRKHTTFTTRQKFEIKNINTCINIIL